MPGEQLPPVIATLEGDDSAFLEMLDRDVAALRAAAGEIDGLLAGLDLGAALADSLSTANLTSLNTDQIAQGLSEAMGGIGSALGQDVGSQLTDAVRSEGIAAGAALAEGVAEGAAGAGDTIGQDLTNGLVSEASSAGSRAGEALSESLTGAASGVGQDVASQVDAELGSLPGRFAAVGATAGHAMTASLEGALLGLAGAAVGAAGALTGIGAAIEARLVDVLVQAGQSAGPSLIAGISAGAAGSASAVAGAVGTAIEASLGDALTQAGGPGGDALMAGMQAGARDGAATAAVAIGEALQAPLEAQMTHVGQVAGDAFNAGFGESSAPSAGTGGNFIDIQKAEQEIAQQGAAIEAAEAAEFRRIRQAQIARAQKAFAENPLGITPYEGHPSMSRAAEQEQQRAAAEQALSLMPSREEFLALSDEGVGAFIEETQAKLAELGPQVADAFSNVMRRGLGRMVWVDEMTEMQYTALEGAISGEFTRLGQQVAPEAEAAMQEVGTAATEALQASVASTGSEVADQLIAEVVQARQAATDELVQLAVAAGEQGDAAGGRFSTFFSQAVSGLKAPFERDPEKAAAAAATAGTEAADAMVTRIEQGLGVLPEVAGEEGGAAGGRFAQFFSDAWNAMQVPFARDPERFAEAGGEAGVEYANAFAAQLEARLAEVGAAGDPELAGLIEQQLQAQLEQAAAEATAAYEQQLTEGLATAQAAAAAQAAGLDTVAGQLDAVFTTIWQHGTLMSSQLAGAMTNALAGIEADTTGFTTQELAQWDQFFTTLEERGTAAAYQLAVSMGSMQGKDVVGMGRGSTGLPMGQTASEAQALAGDLGNVEKAAAGATGAFGGLSAMMYGPLGMAAFGVMSFLPMLSGLFQSSAVTADQFTQAVQQDSNAVGDNTAQTISQTLAKTNLSAISQQLGVSQAQLIEYAAGEASVQQSVTDAYNQQVDALDKAAQAQDTYASTTTKNHAGTRGPNMSLVDLQQQKQALDEVTAAVQQAVKADADQSAALLAAEQSSQIYTAAVNALGQAQLLQVQQTKMQNEATAEFGNQVLFAESSVSYMNAAMGAAVASARESALTNAYASVGLLNLGTAQTELNAQLAAGETQYTEATQGAQAYNTVLTSLNGTTNTLLGSEASFTTTLNGLTTAVKSNGDSLDVNTVKGAANITAITGIATAAQAAAVAVYQNDVANGNASNAYQDASNKLAQEKVAFEQAADKAGLNKDKVKELADELFKLPPSVTTTVNADVGPAENNLAQLLERINTSSGTVTVYENSAGMVGSTQGQRGGGARASGGPVEAGQVYRVNESGAEGYFVPPADGYIIPHDAMAALGSGAGTLGPAFTGAPGGGVSSAPQVTVHVYLNGHEISAEMRAEVQQYANHNAFTGFESLRG